jgi:ribonuclease Z
MDHSQALPMILTAIHTEPKIYVPVESLKGFDNYIDSYFKLALSSESYERKFRTYGVMPDDTIDLCVDNYYAKVYKLYHDVPTVGYGILQKRTKLKEEFMGKTSKELKEIKKKCISLCTEIHVPIMVYLTDTNISIFGNKEIFTYPTIIIECTFITEIRSPEHISWIDIEPYIKKYSKITFVLIHFSKRYTTEELTEFFKIQCKMYPNVKPKIDN